MSSSDDALKRVLQELEDVANEAARLDQALDQARQNELKPRFSERRLAERRQRQDRRAADRRTTT